jgi:uncharacterized protein YdaU (DUF1376 family)
MSDQPYMPLFPADFLADTLHLSAAEIGQYMLILMAMWRNGGYLPDDDAMLARVARETLSPAVRAMLDNDGKGRICQKRLLRELDYCKQRSRARSEAGKRGAEAKHRKNNELALAKPDVLPPANGKQTDSTHTQLATKVANRARSFPENWVPENLSPPETAEFEKFRDHFRANGKRMKDWEAAWRNWKRRAPDFSARGSPLRPSSTVMTGPWKPIKPELDPPKPPPEERERQIARLRGSFNPWRGESVCKR